MPYYGLDWTIILLIPPMILAFWAQSQVKGNFARYSRVENSTGLTGAEAARRVLDSNGLSDVAINQIAGSLTDNYNPKDRTLNLSETVYGVPSVAAVSVACHEAGHAIQHARGYAPLKLRNSIVPVVSVCSSLSWILIIIGLGIVFSGTAYAAGGGMGNTILNIGILAFAAVVFFHLITLPVEFDASKRALQQMDELGVVSDSDLLGSKKVLRAAAMTYVAAAASSIASLLRILIIAGRRN